MSALEAAAYEYQELGLCIIAVDGNKKPVGKWEQFQTRRPSSLELQEMLAHPKTRGLAVIHGEVSGYLVCRDFDSVEAYHRWAELFPDRAKHLPTARTGRGYHVYFIGEPGLKFEKFHDGELRTGNNYTVLPPSEHWKSGTRYRWERSFAEGLPDLDPVLAGLSRCYCDRCSGQDQFVTAQRGQLVAAGSVASVMYTEVLEKSEKLSRETELPEDAEGPEVYEQKESPRAARKIERGGEGGAVGGDDEWVNDPASASDASRVAVARFPEPPATVMGLVKPLIPTHRHTNHSLLFVLARGVLSIEEAECGDGRHWREDLLAVKRAEVFGTWWTLSKEFCDPSLTRLDYWHEFLDACEQARVPLGHDVIEEAFREASATVDAPDPAADAFLEDQKYVVLVHACRELQRRCQPSPFFLTFREIAGRVGVCPKTAFRMVHALVREGIIKVSARGGQHRANRYYYLPRFEGRSRELVAKLGLVDSTGRDADLENSEYKF